MKKQIQTLYLSLVLVAALSTQLHAGDMPAGQPDWPAGLQAATNLVNTAGSAAAKVTKVFVDGGLKAGSMIGNGAKNLIEDARRRADEKQLKLQQELNYMRVELAHIDQNLMDNPTNNQKEILEGQKLRKQREIEQKIAAITSNETAMAELQDQLIKSVGKGTDQFFNMIGDTAKALVTAPTEIAKARIAAVEKSKSDIITNRDRIKFLSNPAILGAVTAAVVGTYYGLKFTYQVVEDWYKVPELADKTTLVGPMTKLWRLITDTEIFNTTLDDVVLNPALTATFKNYVESTKNIIENGGHLRHLLLPGPPGTGKTTLGFALAGELGIDAIYFNAGKLRNCPLDISLRRLDQIFKNAENGDKPILVVIDESEVIFKHRDSKDLSEDTKMVQNALMARLGTPQNDFIVIALTNRPQDFDPAFISRFNNRIIEILPPVLEQRTQMVELYIKKYLINPTFKPKTGWFDSLFSDLDPVAPTIDEDVFTPERIALISQKIDGFTGRDINNLFMDIYSEAAATSDMHITKVMVDTIVDDMVKNIQKYVVPQTLVKK